MENTQPTPVERGVDFFLIKFLQANPGEELSTEDIAVKWDVPQSGIHSRLSVARAKRLVDRRRDEDGTWYYMAGAALTAAPVATLAPATQATPAAAEKPAQTARPSQALPGTAGPLPGTAAFLLGSRNLDAIELQSDIPLPSIRPHGTLMHSFQKLLRRMQPGQCTPPLPHAWRFTARKAITAQHTKSTGPRYTVRTVDAAHIRVWRTQ